MNDRLKLTGWFAVTATMTLFGYWLGYTARPAIDLEQQAQENAARRLADDAYREEAERLTTRPWLANPEPTPSAGGTRESAGRVDPSYESTRTPTSP